MRTPFLGNSFSILYCRQSQRRFDFLAFFNVPTSPCKDHVNIHAVTNMVTLLKYHN